MKKIPYAVLLCMLACFSHAVPTSYVFDDFEVLNPGVRWAVIEMSRGADPRMLQVEAPVRSGTYACSVNIPAGETIAFITQRRKSFVPNGQKNLFNLEGKPVAVGLWIFGEAAGQRVEMTVYDSARSPVKLDLGVVDFKGWKFLKNDIPEKTLPKFWAVRKKRPMALRDCSIIWDC